MTKELPIAARIRSALTVVPNFPRAGVRFLSLLSCLPTDPQLFDQVSVAFADRYRSQIDLVAAVDSRGYLYGIAIALKLKLPFLAITKAGKTPPPVAQASYALEYGSAALEIAQGIVPKDARVLVIDDVLATGGTASAACALVTQVGGKVIEFACIAEISALRGRDKIAPTPVFSLLSGEF